MNNNHNQSSSDRKYVILMLVVVALMAAITFNAIFQPFAPKCIVESSSDSMNRHTCGTEVYYTNK